METIAQQKQELVRLIESVSDPNVLEAIRNLLNEIDDADAWKRTLNVIADEAEQAIKLGNVHSSEEFKVKIAAKLSGLK
ncbi:MAG: hypothetical protein LW721_02950 [Flammeovirgaceae bacterium]|jgi:Arc/MetJ-type ribon-helix-helix transcriptional regulator|nr:hypothetical protein [Flammeovirgaceae bacterium]